MFLGRTQLRWGPPGRLPDQALHEPHLALSEKHGDQAGLGGRDVPGRPHHARGQVVPQNDV